MVLLRRPLPRFLFWAVVLVGIAVATGLGGLAWWWIVLIELVAWGLVTLAERAISNRPRSTASMSRSEPTLPPAATEPEPAGVTPTGQAPPVASEPEPAAPKVARAIRRIERRAVHRERPEQEQ